MRYLIVLLALAGCASTPQQGIDVQQVFRAAVSGDKAAFDQLIRQAESGDATAQNLLGNYYSNQDAANPHELDPVEAFKWHSRAARGGSVYAQGALADEYLHGRGTDQNTDVGMAWLRIAADRGEPLALYNLGNVYRRPGAEQDLIQTYRWWTVMMRRIVDGDIKSFPDPAAAIPVVRERRAQIAERMAAEQIAEAERLAEAWRPKTWEEIRAEAPI